MKNILRIIKESDPHVVCLQEVTEVCSPVSFLSCCPLKPNHQKFLEILEKDSHVKEKYIVTDVTGETFKEGCWYGCIMMVDKRRLELVKATLVDFTTHGQGRRLVVIEAQGRKGVSELPLVRIERFDIPISFRVDFYDMELFKCSHFTHSGPCGNSPF